MDFFPIGLEKLGLLRFSKDNKKAEVTSESTEGAGGSPVFLRGERALGTGRILPEDQEQGHCSEQPQA